MPVKINLRHLEENSKHLEGEISAAELDFNDLDEMIQSNSPLLYDFEIERNGQNLLVQGALELTLDCECVRCLKKFKEVVRLDPYDLIIPLEGEDKAHVDNDMVDLTPYLREDILLAFPAHPVCNSECDRLPKPLSQPQPGPSSQDKDKKSAWDALDKLKF